MRSISCASGNARRLFSRAADEIVIATASGHAGKNEGGQPVHPAPPACPINTGSHFETCNTTALFMSDKFSIKLLSPLHE